MAADNRTQRTRIAARHPCADGAPIENNWHAITKARHSFVRGSDDDRRRVDLRVAVRIALARPNVAVIFMAITGPNVTAEELARFADRLASLSN
jgi:hypothetical protein